MSTAAERAIWRAAEADLAAARWIAVGDKVCYAIEGSPMCFLSNRNTPTPNDVRYVALARNTYKELLDAADELDRLKLAFEEMRKLAHLGYDSEYARDAINTYINGVLEPK